MERHREPVTYRFEGPLPRKGLPEEVLYDPVLSLRHDAGDDHTAFRAALEALAGGARMLRLPVFGTRVTARGTRWRVSATAKRDRYRLRVHHRLKGGGVKRLVEALNTIPGARDLHIEATRERYERPYSSVGPCSPCAAPRFGSAR